MGADNSTAEVTSREFPEALAQVADPAYEAETCRLVAAHTRAQALLADARDALDAAGVTITERVEENVAPLTAAKLHARADSETRLALRLAREANRRERERES